MESRIPIPLIMVETEPGPSSDSQSAADHFMALQKRRILAGVNLLCLSPHKELLKTMTLIRRAIGRNCFVAGKIFEVTAQTFDETISEYKKQVEIFKDSGIDLIVFDRFTSMPQMRAATFAARKIAMPAIITCQLFEDGKSLDDLDPLAALISLQSLGIYGFGISCSSADLCKNLKELTPYAKIPVFAEPIFDRSLVFDEFSNYCDEILKTGVKIINWPSLSYDQLKTLSLKASEYKSVYPEKEEVVAVSGLTEAYFLDEDRIEFSKPITCGFSLEDDLIDIEDEEGTVTLVKLDTENDVDIFLNLSHILRLPVAFYTNSEELLRRTLQGYHGKAIIDSKCEIDKIKLKELADEYGALIY